MKIQSDYIVDGSVYRTGRNGEGRDVRRGIITEYLYKRKKSIWRNRTEKLQRVTREKEENGMMRCKRD